MPSVVRLQRVAFILPRIFARAQVPPGVVDMLLLGRLTALTKPDGGVRGIVVRPTLSKD